LSRLKTISGNKGSVSNALQCQPDPKTSPSPARIWAIGGGKGGTGKSFVASNFGMILAKQSKKVLLIDADLGAANLHTFLGIKGTALSFSSFLKAEIQSLDPLIQTTGIVGLDIITGAMDSLDVAQVNDQAINRLEKGLSRTDYDYIILDIGPGTTTNMLRLFLLAHNSIIVTTPEPTSIENTYRYVNCLLLQKVRNIICPENNSVLRGIILSLLRDYSNRNIKTVNEIILLLKREEVNYPGLLDIFMSKTSLSLVISQSRSNEDKAFGPKMSLACNDFFGLDISYTGDIPYIEGMREFLSQKKPFTAGGTMDRKTSEALESCVAKLLTDDKRNKDPLKAD